MMFDGDPDTITPSPLLTEAVPVRLVPMRLPLTSVAVVLTPFNVTPLRLLPEITLPVSVEPPIKLFVLVPPMTIAS